MLRYRIVCVGRRARDPLVAAAEGYLERLTRYVPTELVRLREGPADREAAQIHARLERLSPADPVIALQERGEELTSAGLAARVRQWQQNTALGHVVFVIGGAEGLAASVARKAHHSLSLSRMTLPHRLALVVLLEQLYRAHTIVRGEKYHRGG